MDLYRDRSSIAIILFCALVIISTAVAFLPVMDAFIFAATIAVVLMPLKRILARRISERGASLIIVFSVMISALAVTLFLFLIIYGISDYAGEMFDGILLWIDNHDSIQSVPMSDNMASDVLFGEDGVVSEIIYSMINSVIYSGIKITIFFVLLYLFLKEGEIIWERLKGIIPKRSLETVSILEIKGTETLYAVYIVQLVTSVVTFALALPFFYLLGLNNVIELSFIAAIFQLIPVIGPSLLMAVLAFYSLSVGDYAGALLLAGIGYPVVCAFPDLVLRPVLMGRRTLVHPAVMWIGFFGGIYVFGMSGLVLGPLLLALMMTAAGILVNIVCSPDASAGTLLAACGVYVYGIYGGLAAAVLVFIGNRICHDKGYAGTTGAVVASFVIWGFSYYGILSPEEFIAGMVLAIVTIQGLSHKYSSRLLGKLWRFRS